MLVSLCGKDAKDSLDDFDMPVYHSSQAKHFAEKETAGMKKLALN